MKSITPQGLVIVQDVNDPLSLVKQREVRKLLRSLEDAKPMTVTKGTGSGSRRRRWRRSRQRIRRRCRRGDGARRAG